MNIKNSQFGLSENSLKKLLERGVKDGVFPGAAAGIFYRNNKIKKRIVSCCGNAALVPRSRKLTKDGVFDLASLTKPLGTTLAILVLLKMGNIKLAETLPSLLQKNVMGEKSKITLAQLLNHTSGLPAHREYFKKLRELSYKERIKTLETWILEEQLEATPGTKREYSDLGFMLLGRIIEIQSNQTLDRFVGQKIMQPLGLKNKIFFNDT